MSEFDSSNFNNILRKIIKKSLFTQRQIEIILNQKNLQEIEFNISRGAYYRQVNQSRDKLTSFFYTVVLLRSLGVLLPDDIDVISRLADQVSVISNSDVFPERESEIMSVIEKVVHQACNL